MRKITPVSSLSDRSDQESDLPIANPSSVPFTLLTSQEKRRKGRRRKKSSTSSSAGNRASGTLLAFLLVIAVFVILEVILLDRFFLGPEAKLVDVQIEDADVFVQAVGDPGLGMLPNLFSQQQRVLGRAKERKTNRKQTKLRAGSVADVDASELRLGKGLNVVNLGQRMKEKAPSDA